MKPPLDTVLMAYHGHRTFIHTSFIQAASAVLGYIVNLLCMRIIGPDAFGHVVLYMSIGGVYAILLNFGDEYVFVNRTPSNHFYFRLILGRAALIICPAILIGFISQPLAALSFTVFASQAIVSRHFIEVHNAQVEEMITIALLRLPLAAAVFLTGSNYVAMTVFFANALLPIVPRVTALFKYRVVDLAEERINGKMVYLLNGSAMAAPILNGLVPRIVLGFLFGSRALADVYVVHQLTQPFLIVVNSIISIYRRQFIFGIKSRFALFTIVIAIGLGLLQASTFPILHLLGLADLVFGFEPSPFVWFLGVGLILQPVIHSFVMFSRQMDIITVNIVVGGVGIAAMFFFAHSIEQALCALTLMPLVVAIGLIWRGIVSGNRVL